MQELGPADVCHVKALSRDGAARALAGAAGGAGLQFNQALIDYLAAWLGNSRAASGRRRSPTPRAG